MKVATKGRVVCCPRCGTCGTVSEIGMNRLLCKNKDCNTKFGGWVVNGFVITFEETDSDYDYLSMFDACKAKLEMLNELK